MRRKCPCVMLSIKINNFWSNFIKYGNKTTNLDVKEQEVGVRRSKPSYLLCWLRGSPSTPAGRPLGPCSGRSSRWTCGHIFWVWLSSSGTFWKASALSCWCRGYRCCPAGRSTSGPPSPPECDWGRARQTWTESEDGINTKLHPHEYSVQTSSKLQVKVR